MTHYRMFSHWLMASFLYYKYDISIVGDSDFDMWSKELLKGWDEWEHPHKYLVQKIDLDAGTGYAIRDYPLIVQGAAWSWLDTVQPERQIAKGRGKRATRRTKQTAKGGVT